MRCTRSRVAGATSERWLITLETVGTDTPAAAATSARVRGRSDESSAMAHSTPFFEIVFYTDGVSSDLLRYEPVYCTLCGRRARVVMAALMGTLLLAAVDQTVS